MLLTEKLRTVPEISKTVLNVSPTRGYQLVRAGILPPDVVIRPGWQIRINEAKLRGWLEAGGKPLAGGWRRTPKTHENSSPTNIALSRPKQHNA